MTAAVPWWELRGWSRCVAFWDQRESPWSLALVRICLGLVVLADLTTVWRLDLVVTLFGVGSAGGLSDANARNEVPLWYALFPATEGSAWLLWGSLTALALSFTLGFFTRSSAFLLMILWAQWALVLPASDRGIDALCRNILCIFAFSYAGEGLGLDGAWRRLRGQALAAVPAWPRYLLVLQLVVMYWMAGIQKVGLEWTPMGEFAALYVILQDPAIAAMDFAWLYDQPWYFSTQLSTLVTVLWQWSYPVVLLWYWYEHGPVRPGRIRAACRRWHFKWIWVVVGAIFHVVLAVTMELGIFPWAMMAIYPAFIHPDEWAAGWRRLTGRG
ncbi:MAG: HTTM domain-containing protein [Deltaproteobacteria bacterium]|nr:HTTM domain-containing protein [Deltaproteobacteria bacterium]